MATVRRSDNETAEADVDWKLATVKHDGRWYLSAFYSIAENARNDGYDIPETGVVAHGADTPEGAVQAIFDAVDDLDLEALIAAAQPQRGRGAAALRAACSSTMRRARSTSWVPRSRSPTPSSP